MSTPWKDPRTGVYYIRRGVPTDLRGQLGWTYKRSLQTKDVKEAKQLFPLALAKSERLFAEARGQVGQPERTDISREEAERLADAWLAMLLEEDEDERIKGVDDVGFRKRQETLDIVDMGGRDALARGDTHLVEFEVEDFIESYQLRIAKGSTAYRKLCFAFLKASVKATELTLKRQQGESVDTPVMPSPEEIAGGKVKSDDAGVPISDVYGRWKQERKPTAKLAAEWDKAFRRFTELHGDLPVASITRRQVSAFKEALAKTPSRPPRKLSELPFPEVVDLVGEDESLPKLQPASIRKDLAAIQVVLGWAVENGYREDNPAGGIKVRVAKNVDDEARPYAHDDLALIFRSPVFTERFRPLGGSGEAAYWLPLLGLFTGARLEELGTLLASDIQEEDGCPLLHINTLDEGKSVKNKGSRRKVPLHPDLTRLGFLDYVASCRASGPKAKLFPDLRPKPNGQTTGNWSRWWGRYVKSLGVKRQERFFHAFRHTFKTQCRDAGIGKEFHDAITGHASGDVGDAYGRTYPVKVLAREMEKVRYEGVDLSHLN